ELLDLTPQGTGWFDFMEPGGQYDIAPDGSEITFVANSSAPPHRLLRWALSGVSRRRERPRRLPRRCTGRATRRTVPPSCTARSAIHSSTPTAFAWCGTTARRASI